MTGQIARLQYVHVKELVLEIRYGNAGAVQLLENLYVLLAHTVAGVGISNVMGGLVETPQEKLVLPECELKVRGGLLHDAVGLDNIHQMSVGGLLRQQLRVAIENVVIHSWKHDVLISTIAFQK